MALRGNPPRGKNGGEHWKYIGDHGPRGWYGFTAGPAIGLDTHPSVLGPRPKTKPCLHALTGGQLACPWCGKMPLGWHCYLPLWREEDSRPCLLVMGEDMWDRASTLEPLELVFVSRGTQKSDGTFITKHGNRRKFITSLPSREQPQDISAALLTIWGVPELTSWYALRGASDNAVSLPPPPPPAPEPTPKERQKMEFDEYNKTALPLLRKRFNLTDPPSREPKMMADVLAELPAQVQPVQPVQPSSNGKPKKAKPSGG